MGTKQEPYVLRITFGTQYATEPHPRVSWAHPDGWLEVVLETPPADRQQAREIARYVAVAHLGSAWAFDYPPDRWGPDNERFYPLGVLARASVTQVNGEFAPGAVEVFHEFAPGMVEVKR